MNVFETDRDIIVYMQRVIKRALRILSLAFLFVLVFSSGLLSRVTDMFGKDSEKPKEDSGSFALLSPHTALADAPIDTGGDGCGGCCGSSDSSDDGGSC